MNVAAFTIIAVALLTLILSPTARHTARRLLSRDFPLRPVGLAPLFERHREGRA